MKFESLNLSIEGTLAPSLAYFNVYIGVTQLANEHSYVWGIWKTSWLLEIKLVLYIFHLKELLFFCS